MLSSSFRVWDSCHNNNKTLTRCILISRAYSPLTTASRVSHGLGPVGGNSTTENKVRFTLVVLIRFPSQHDLETHASKTFPPRVAIIYTHPRAKTPGKIIHPLLPTC